MKHSSFTQSHLWKWMKQNLNSACRYPLSVIISVTPVTHYPEKIHKHTKICVWNISEQFHIPPCKNKSYIPAARAEKMWTNGVSGANIALSFDFILA